LRVEGIKDMKEIKIALLGFGNAGQAFAKLLIKKSNEIAKTYETKVVVVAIATRSKGTVIDEKGLNLEEIIVEIEKDGKFSKSINMSALETANQVNYDILVELTPLEIFSGQPAINHIKAGLNRGKHVITANKGPVAWAYRELKELANQKRVQFLCETTVMDGTPIFNLVEDTLKFCKVIEINGILNTTTNFILEEMGKGIPYENIIEEGKRRGFVETDPSTDVEGYDASAKVTALMNVLMDAGITPENIERQGIENITYENIKQAEARGKVIKLLCNGKYVNGKAVGAVRPVEMEKGDMLAAIDGTSSIVSITTDLMGTISIIEHNPEIEQTAYGIFSDMVRIISNISGHI
jgi:homoserine dehydrogenase